jgi:acyl-CoA synthetase (NDP forming)/GNAT superfamily N-acetyltransferase
MTSAADVLLVDGTVASIRPLLPEDRSAVEALHTGLSDESFRRRFFSTGRAVGHQYVEHLFADDTTTTALLAFVSGHVVALATAEPVDATTADVAFLVADNLRGHGVGILLLEHLAAASRSRGVTRFVAEVLSENAPMTRVFRAAGFEVTSRASAGVIDIEMSTAASEHAVAAADARESTSEARSLEALCSPRRVAVVGASRRGTGIGSAVLASISDGNFAGEVMIVHPRATRVAGYPAYRRLVDAPGHIDVVVVAVPARAVHSVVEDAAAAGASTVVVLSSGFAELGDEGAAMQRALVHLARRHSVRLIGPNCLGVQVNDPLVRLNATFTRLVPRPGGLAVASQSGGVGVALLEVASRTGLGLRTFVSLGNKADVSGNDLLAAWYDDPEVTAAGLYLESFGNAPKFARVARRFSERKPLLVVLGGRSIGGRRGGTSHTAAAATSAVAADALFGHSGVIRCRDADELAETALFLAEQPLPAGPRTAIVTNAGGMGILAADAADAAGLLVPPLSDDLQARLRAIDPGIAGTTNPVDIGANASSETLRTYVTALFDSGEVDALLVVLVETRVADTGPLSVAVGEARAEHPEIPVVLVTIGADDAEGNGAPTGLTVMPTVSAAVGTLARTVRYAAWLAVPRTEPMPGDPERARQARRRARDLLANETTGWLTPAQSMSLLSLYDLAPTGRTAHGPEEASVVAATLGFPVAVKIADPDIAHKTERGLVRTGLLDAAAVGHAVAAFEVELGSSATVLVQPMAAGVEMALGLVQDPTLGPLVMIAAGGTAIDVWDDRVFLLPPVDAGSITRAVRSLRSWPLLDGHRGTPRVDVVALERQILALGQLGTDVPEIAEVDLNPVLVGVDGTHLVDVKVRLAVGASLDSGIPRRLRPTS